jgi:hypothetical protein
VHHAKEITKISAGCRVEPKRESSRKKRIRAQIRDFGGEAAREFNEKEKNLIKNEIVINLSIQRALIISSYVLHF